MLRLKSTLAVSCLLIMALIFAACQYLGGNETPNDTRTVDVPTFGDTICDQFLAAMPPPGSARIEAGKPCVDALPSLSPADQLRIANYYAAQLPNFIPTDQLADLASTLDSQAALPLQALNMRYVIQGDYETESLAAKKLLEEAEAAKNQAAIVNAMFAELLVPVASGQMKEFDDTRMEAALAIAARENMRGQEPYLRNLWALAHNLRGNNVESLENYQLARQGFEKNQNYSGTSMALTNLSYIYSEFQDNDQAIEFAQAAIEALDARNFEDPDKRAAALIALGEHFSAAERHSEALAAFEAVFDLAERKGIFVPAETAIDKFRALHKSGETKAAIDLATERLETQYFSSDSFAILEVLVWLGARHAEMGMKEEAERYAQSVFQVAGQRVDGDEDVKQFTFDLGNGYFSPAFGQDLLLLSIAIGSDDYAIKVTNWLEAKYRERVENSKVQAIAGHELQTTIDALGIEAQRNALQLKSSRQQFLLAALSALALGVIAFIAYRSFRTQKQLTATQKQLTAEKDIYLAEIHHRTKNNFQLLSSLLNMDIRRSDVATQGEGRRQDAVNRLQTMALVHDHIYSLDASKETTVELSEFIDDLLALLDTSLGRDDITLEWAVEGGAMDVTRLTPFGLLLCEIITNSYKHAFSDRGGAITVDIIEENGTRKMTLKDNGMGFDVEAAKNKPDSLGMGLIFDLADQVGGTLSVESGANGTIWTFQ